MERGEGVQAASENTNFDKSIQNSNFRKFLAKELFDRIGYGFASQQFINVLFFLSGASIFLVGLMNGFKSAISIILGIFAHEYNNFKRISKRVVGFSGVLLGFSFLAIAIGGYLDSIVIFSIALIASGISIVLYGDFSQNYFALGRKREILEKLATYGLIVTGLSLFFSAFLIDRYSDGVLYVFTMFGKAFVISMPGYFIALEVAALSFILSGYFFGSIREARPDDEKQFSFSFFFNDLKHKLAEVFHSRFTSALVAFNISMGLIQVIGHSYYGIFIYQNFKDVYFGGFMNIAVVFLIGVFSSLIGYFTAKLNTRSYGPVPMLAIGGFFVSLMPFMYYLGTGLGLLTAGTIMGVIGSSAIGVSSSMLVIEMLHEQDRKYFYIFNGLFSLVPYLILTPVFSYVAQYSGLKVVFLLLAAISMLSTLFVLFSYKLLK